MKSDHQHTANSKYRLIKRLSLALLLVIFLIPAYAQNTKGDQPSKSTRESKFKSKSKKKSKDSDKRVRSRKSQASSAKKGPRESGRAWKGDISGRSIPATRSSKKRSRQIFPQGSRTVKGAPGNNDDVQTHTGGRPPKRIQPRSASSRTRNVYPQSGPYVKKTRPPTNDDSQTKFRSRPSSQPRVRSFSGRSRNVFPQRGPYVAKTRPPSTGDRPYSRRGSKGFQGNVRSATGSNRNVYQQKGSYVAKIKQPARGDRPIRWSGSTVARQKIRSASGSARNVYQQKGSHVARLKKPATGDMPRKWKGSVASQARVRTATGRTKNVFNQRGPYVSNPSTQPRQSENPPGKRRKKIPASASKPFMRRTSINPYAGFWNKKPKKERAYIGDISGKKIRAKNYETPRPEIIEPNAVPYLKRKRVGDTPYTGKAAGKHVSATRSARAWQGDISGRRLRDRNQSSKGPAQVGKPLAKLPFTGDPRMGGRRNFRSSPKGGGSVSGKSSNNNNRPLVGKAPGIGARAAGFQGNIKARKREPGTEVGGIPKIKAYSHVTMRKQGEGFTGYVKAKKPMKGGGSVSGKLWNNNEKALVGKSPGIGAQAGNFQGNIKARKKEPVDVGGFPKTKVYSHVTMRKQGEDFTGYVKAKKPKKGGGSVSGELWNNNEKSIAGRGTKGSDVAIGNYQGNVKVSKQEPGKEIGGFPGKYKMFDLHPSMRDQGEEFTGYIRRSRLKNDYVRNSLSAKEALKKMRPGQSTYQVEGLQVRVKESDYKKKPNAADGSMPGIAPGKSSIKASEYARGAKLDWKYVRNASSDEEALKVRETGKAFARVNDYQGNVKMKKFELFAKKNLHPDAQFVKTNKNNVKEEKSLVTNFKLLWSRFFKKSETQPDHLKEKLRKPRYDKGEVGLWYN